MIAPDFNAFKRLARKGNRIALVRTIPADLETPVSSFLKLSRKSQHVFLLESAEQEQKIGRYSFMGSDPKLILNSNEDGLMLDRIKKILAQYKLANPEAVPGFSGGFVGYLGYENVESFEKINLEKRPGPAFPDALFFFVENFLIFDHFRKTLSVVELVPVEPGQNLKKIHDRACKNIARRIAELKKPLRLFSQKNSKTKLSIQSNTTKKEFCKKVNRIKEYIRAGDCIQVVLSQRFSMPAKSVDGFQIYRALRSINPSPYMFYFKSGKFQIIGTSPELLVKKTGPEAEVRPIAGTRPRGTTPAQDAAFEESLKKSPKEMAEHLMLVDLGRNDLGRVCKFDSIRVKNFARTERYSHVMHLVSDVTGTLQKGKDAFALLKATFPAGTVTGAPKIRAMQIINELESEKRGPYAGSLGYFSFNGDMDMCITIRTLFSDGKKIYLQAGAGIVKDSSPEKEYQETVNKAKALFKALARRGEF